jgi:hypothetical protein
MSRSILKYAFVLSAISVAADASAATFTDRAAFNAAAGTVKVETFESSPIVGTVDTGAVQIISFADFKVGSTPVATKLLATDHYFGAFNTTPGGARYLYIDTDVGLLGSMAVFAFNSPIRAIGFDYTSFGEPGSTFNLTVQGTTYAIAPNANANASGFWGYTSTTDFSNFSFTASTDSGYAFDQVTYTGVVPEPQSVALLAFGMVVIGVGVRRRPR